MLLISVSYLGFSQQNYINNGLKLNHRLNENPQEKTFQFNNHFMFRQAAAETLYVYAMMVQFKPDNEGQTTGDGRFDNSHNYPDSVDAPPHDSLYFSAKLEFLKNYYWKASKGKLFINYRLFGTVRNLSKEMKDYSPVRQENLKKMTDLFYDSWRSADSIYDFSGIDPSKSAFMIFHAGVGRDVDLSGYFQGEYDLPSIYLSNSTLKSVLGDTTRGYYTNEGVIIPSSCMLPEQEYRIVNSTFGDQFLEICMNGIVVGTLGSALGLPDLFNTSDGTTAIGRFGLMDGQGIFSYLGVFPPEPSAWEKTYLGWVDPIVVNNNGTFTTKAASIDFNGNESVYKVLISAKEYFLIENRNRDANNNGQIINFIQNGVPGSLTFLKDQSGFENSDIWKLKGNIVDVDELDWSVPGLKNDTANFQGGILVWHIDENIIDAKFASNTINADKNHRGVDVEEAKGSQDIGVKVSTPFGDQISDGFFVDFWYNGEHYRPSNIYRNEFTPTSTPNTNSNSNINSRVCLTSFSAIGSSMTFNYQQCGSITNIQSYPRFVGKDTSGNAQPIGFDYNGIGGDEVFVNVKDSLYGFRDNGNPIRVDMPNGYLFDSSAGFIPGYTNATISGHSKFVIGVKNNLLTLLNFTIDTVTTAPFFLRYELPNGVFTTPSLELINPPVRDSLLLGTSTGKLAKISVPSLNPFFDSVSNRSIREIAFNNSPPLPPVSFIDTQNKFLTNGYFKDTGSSQSRIVVTNDNKLLYNGAIISNNLGINTIYSSPVCADINKDGTQEIIFTADDKVFAVNKYGVLIDHFPFSIPNVNKISSGCSVADLNSDGIYEVIFGTGDGRIYAYGIDGKILDGFPLLAGSEIKSTPAIVNTGGNFGLIVYSTDGYLYGFKTPWAYDSNKILWKNYLRDKQHLNSGLNFPEGSTSSECLPKDKVYNWPNPAYGQSTNIRYYLGGDVSAVNIKIMDLSGELVTTLKGTTNKGFENEVPWDITAVQSGVYFAIVELVGGCGEAAAIKVAVVK
jgi:M6 family metalloprotease-like protein